MQLARQKTKLLKNNKFVIPWKVIGAELNRSPIVCYEKHRSYEEAHMKHGPFTPSEDALILQRVNQGGNVYGIWSRLGVEMNRPATAVRSRYHRIVQQQGSSPSPRKVKGHHSALKNKTPGKKNKSGILKSGVRGDDSSCVIGSILDDDSSGSDGC